MVVPSDRKYADTASVMVREVVIGVLVIGDNARGREFLDWADRRAWRPLAEWEKRLCVAHARMIGDL